MVDLETSSAKQETTQILEIAALVIDPKKWAPIPGSEFETLVRPEDFSALEAGAMAKNKIAIADLEKAPSIKTVFPRFYEHVRRFGGKTASPSTAPFPAGQNVRGFDLPILDRYAERFGYVNEAGESTLFNKRVVLDTLDDLFRWFGQTNQTDSIGMDAVRDYFGIPKDGAHRGMTDVRHTAWVLCKFMNFYRRLAVQMAPKFRESGQHVDFSDYGTWGV